MRTFFNKILINNSNLFGLFKKISVILIFIVITNQYRAQTNWSQLHSVNGYASSAIHVLNDTQLYIAGSNPSVSVNFGTGYSSLDNGNNWSEFTFGINAGWGREIFYTHQDTGYFVSQNFGILKTINGGVNWNNVSLNAISNKCAEFIDGNIFYVGKSNGNIEKTINGGANWSIQNTPSSFGINRICFIDINIGYATSEAGIILKTTDGGNNWTQVLSGVTYNLNEIDFPQADTGFVLERNNISTNSTRLLKTMDGGASWNEYTPTTSNLLYGLKMINTLEGYIVGENSTVLKTTDGGQNWISLTTNIPPGQILSNIFITSSNIYVSGEGVYKSTLTTGISNRNSNKINDDVSIFPSPTISKLFINTNNNIEYISITDLSGRILKSYGNNLHELDVSNLNSGVYFIQLYNNEKVIVRKFIKE